MSKHQANSSSGASPNDDSCNRAESSGTSMDETGVQSTREQRLVAFEEEILAKDAARCTHPPDMIENGPFPRKTAGQNLTELEASILSKLSCSSRPGTSSSFTTRTSGEANINSDGYPDVERGLIDPCSDKSKTIHPIENRNDPNVEALTDMTSEFVASIMPLPSHNDAAPHIRIVQPGAYAESGYGGRYGHFQPPQGLRGERAESHTRSEEIRPDENTSSLAVAHPVAGLDDDSDDGLPRAIGVEQPRDAVRVSLARKRVKETWLAFGSVAIIFILLIGLALSLMLIVPSKENEATELPVKSNVTQVQHLSWESKVLSSFPEPTVEAIQDSDSPQDLAFQWLMNDPFKETYPFWRLKQRFALATFYYSTAGLNWVNDDSWLNYSHHECQWYSSGRFDFFDPNTTYIELSHSNACEEDPTAMESNGVYKHLWLPTNKLRGSLPSEIFWLTSLRSINLDLNALTSSVPSHLSNLQQLEAITLMKNDLTGSLPTELGVLSRATGIWLKGNLLQGKIPSELGSLAKLNHLDLDDNGQLSGTIPTELGRLTNILSFGVAENALTGTIPTELQRLSVVEMFMLSGNDLSGSIPPQVLQRLTRLKVLSLYGNQLTSTIPSAFGQLTELEKFSLYDNNLTGPIPTEFGLLESNLTWMLLHKNQLDSSIPSELGLVRRLAILTVHDTNLSGSIPQEIEALSKTATLEEFSITDTRLTGTIPPGICTLPFLYFNCTGALCGCDCPCDDSIGNSAHR